MKSRRRRSSWMVAGRDDGRLARLLEALGARHADLGAGIAGQRDEDGPVVLFDGRDLRARFFQIFLELERIALNGEIEVADRKTADDVADGAAGQVKIHARGAGDVLHQPDALQLIRRQPDFHRVNVVSHSLSSGCQRLFRLRSESNRDRGEGRNQPSFPQVLHSPGRHTIPAPKPPECKWLNTKYLCEVETLRQAKENNTTFTFWLLPRRIPVVCREKVRESERRPARMSWKNAARRWRSGRSAVEERARWKSGARLWKSGALAPRQSAPHEVGL